jgi:L-lactate dehydrogenase complex protein LldG
MQSFRERWKIRQSAVEVHQKPEKQGIRGIDAEVNKQPLNRDLGQIDDNSHTVEIQSLTTEPLIKRFERELTALEGRLICCASLDLPGHVLNLLQEKEIRSILAWNEVHLPSGLSKELKAAGIKVHTKLNSLNVQDGIITESMIPRAGLTGAIAAVAETGTLVLPGGNGYTLSASMLPEVHIAIFHIQDLYHNLPQVFNLQQVREAPTSTLISGPSRTADIEMTLTIGVHGPSELHVFCVDDSTEKR